MPRHVLLPLFAFLLSTALADGANASFQVLSWELVSGVQDFSGQFMQDGEINGVVTNPWNGALEGVVGINRSRSDHEYAWLVEETAGTFDTSFLNEIRTSDVRTGSSGLIRFHASTDLVVHLSSILSYSHTPGDVDLVNWFIGISNITTGDSLLVRDFDGGNGHNESSSGSFIVDETFLLTGGSSYQIGYNLDCDNVADQLPTGVMNISGYLNWSFTPEPSTISLLACRFLLTCRKRR